MASHGRGRPRQFDEAEVLGSALDAFWRNGFTATSTRNLCDATGLVGASLYNAFGSKLDIFVRALSAYVDNVGALFAAPMEEGDRGLDDIKTFFTVLTRMMFEPGARPGCLVINTMSELGEAAPAVQEQLDAYASRFRGAFESALRRAARAGEIEARGVRGRVELLWGLTVALNVAHRARADQKEIDRLCRAVLTMIDGWRRSDE